MEAALAIATIVAALLLCCAGLAAVALQVRCVDAAREAARLAARGDEASSGVAVEVVPDGASLEVRRDGEFVVARVRARPALLPGLVISGEATALVESGS